MNKKGEYDIVYIVEDLNLILDNIIGDNIETLQNNNGLHASKLLKNSELEEFRLYYVATTRARFTLYNARHLSSEPVLTCERQ